MSLSDDVFENFRYMCINISQLDLAKLLSAGIFKKNYSKIRIFNLYWYELMVEKAIRGGYAKDIYRYAKDNSKIMKDYDKDEESLYLQY